MTSKLHVVYLPGIGDARPGGAQRRAVGLWRWYGVEPEVYELNWADNIPWNQKFEQLLARIDELHSAGKMIGIVGVSAGGSAAINVFAARKNKIVGVVCIAGKIHRPEAIGPRYRRNNTSFIVSVEATEASLKQLSDSDRQRILSRYAITERIVAKADSKVEGAHNRVSLSFGHGFTIAVQITLGASSFIRFLKRLL